jgi:hypothetical protein
MDSADGRVLRLTTMPIPVEKLVPPTANPYRGPCSRLPRSTETTRVRQGELESDHQGAGAVVASFLKLRGTRERLPRELF